MSTDQKPDATSADNNGAIPQHVIQNAHIVSTLSALNPDGTPDFGSFKRPDGKDFAYVEIDANQPELNLITMTGADGQPVLLRQVFEERDGKFHMSAYQTYERNPDYDPNDPTSQKFQLAVDDSGRPTTYVIFPGSQGTTEESNKMARAMVQGAGYEGPKDEQYEDKIKASYDRTIDSVTKLDGLLDEQAEALKIQPSNIVVGGHSKGAHPATIACVALKDLSGIDPEATGEGASINNYLVAPFGARQAMEEVSAYWANLNGGTEADIARTQASIEEASYCFRPTQKTIFSELWLGPGAENGNDMIGNKYSYNPLTFAKDFGLMKVGVPDEQALGTEYKWKHLMPHTSAALPNGLLAGDSIERWEDRDNSGSDWTYGEWDQEQSLRNTEQYIQTTEPLSRMFMPQFNSAANYSAEADMDAAVSFHQDGMAVVPHDNNQFDWQSIITFALSTFLHVLSPAHFPPPDFSVIPIPEDFEPPATPTIPDASVDNENENEAEIAGTIGRDNNSGIAPAA